MFYDPARPDRALLDSFWTLWVGAAFMATFGVMFTGLPLLVLLMLRARAGRYGQRGVRSPDGV